MCTKCCRWMYTQAEDVEMTLSHKFISSDLALISLLEDYAVLYKYNVMLHICVRQQLATTLHMQESSGQQMQTLGKKQTAQSEIADSLILNLQLKAVKPLQLLSGVLLDIKYPHLAADWQFRWEETTFSLGSMTGVLQ